MKLPFWLKVMGGLFILWASIFLYTECHAATKKSPWEISTHTGNTQTASDDSKPTPTPMPYAEKRHVRKAGLAVAEIEQIRVANSKDGVKIIYAKDAPAGRFTENVKKEKNGFTSWTVQALSTGRSTTVYYMADDANGKTKLPYCVYINFEDLLRRE